MPEEGPKGPDGLAWQDTEHPAKLDFDRPVRLHYRHPGRVHCIAESTPATLQRCGEPCCRGRAQRQNTEAEQDGSRPQLSEGGPAKAKAGPQQFTETHVCERESDELA